MKEKIIKGIEDRGRRGRGPTCDGKSCSDVGKRRRGYRIDILRSRGSIDAVVCAVARDVMCMGRSNALPIVIFHYLEHDDRVLRFLEMLYGIPAPLVYPSHRNAPYRLESLPPIKHSDHPLSRPARHPPAPPPPTP